MMSQGLNYTWPGGWSQDRLEQVRHFRHWVYVAVRAIMDKAANSPPNLDYVTDGVTGIKNFVHTRSMGAIQPHDELEPVERDHPMRLLLANPNQMDSPFDFWSELAMFIKLTGNGFIWAIPNHFGVPCELWVLPSQWVWAMPGKNRVVEHYELRPWTSYTGTPALRIPARDVIHIRCKSPITKIDGYATQTGLAQWIDISDSIAMSEWSAFKNSAMPGLHAELGPEYVDPTDAELDRIYEKFFARFQGEIRAGLPIITPPGMKLTGLAFSPTEMAFTQSADHVRDNILAGFGVPRAVVGLATDIQRSNVDGSLAAFCQFTMNPYFAMVGQVLTAHLCSRFDTAKRRMRLWWPDATPLDPAQLNADIQTDASLAAITTNEVRALRGRAPYRRGGNNPWAPSGVVEYPFNEQALDGGVADAVASAGEGRDPYDPAQPSVSNASLAKLIGHRNGTSHAGHRG